MMIITVTGSRFGITDEQRQWLWDKVLQLDPDAIHHGACVGADQHAHSIGLKLGKPLIVHPPLNTTWMMEPDWNHPNVTVLPADYYHSRDRAMVNASHIVLGLPNARQPLQGQKLSGTWYTLGYAHHRKVSRMICLPSGNEIA